LNTHYTILLRKIIIRSTR